MKLLSLSFVVLILASFATVVSAQPVAAPNKIGWINTTAFGDEKNGIVKYVTAIKAAEEGFKTQITELQSLRDRINAIVAELQKTPPGNIVNPQALQGKREEGERLQREYEFKQKEFEAAYGKRRNEMVAPISADILKAIQEYGKQKGYAAILDIGTMAQGNALVHLDPTVDVTKDFVTFYNARSPAAGGAPPK